MIKLKTILHPTDFSKNSQYALEVACSLARDQAASVIVLHVIPLPAPVISGTEVPIFKAEHAVEDLQGYREEMTRLLGQVREQASCAQIEQRLEEGEAASTIVRIAERTPCDLIVMGTHGQSRSQHGIMGSVATAVTNEATCPVVIVKVPGTSF